MSGLRGPARARLLPHIALQGVLPETPRSSAESQAGYGILSASAVGRLMQSLALLLTRGVVAFCLQPRQGTQPKL